MLAVKQCREAMESIISPHPPKVVKTAIATGNSIRVVDVARDPAFKKGSHT